MKKNYIKPDITILKIGSSNGMCALSSEKKTANFLIGSITLIYNIYSYRK